MTNTEYLRARILAGIGSRTKPSTAEARADAVMERLPWLARQGRYRLVMGSYRYEAKDADGLSYEDKAQLGLRPAFWVRAVAKLDEYDRTGNQEMLVDAFNYLLLELHEPMHPRAHFASLERHDT